LLLSAPCSSEVKDVRVVNGSCGKESHISEGRIDEDLSKRQSRFFCDSAVIAFFDSDNQNIMVQFAESKSHNNMQLGFSGIMSEDGQVLNVNKVYLGSKQIKVSEGYCKFFFKDKNMSGIACGAPIDEGSRRTVPVVVFNASPSESKTSNSSSNAKYKVTLPEGWRFPTTEELSDEPLRKKSHSKYIKTIADFNGDGIDDEAYLVKSTKFSGEGLLVRVSDLQNGASSNFKWLVLATIDLGKEAPLGMGIDIATPGDYETACGKGYYECKKGEPKALKIRRPVINYFRFESFNSFFLWDDKTKTFKEIQMSD